MTEHGADPVHEALVDAAISVREVALLIDLADITQSALPTIDPRSEQHDRTWIPKRKFRIGWALALVVLVFAVVVLFDNNDTTPRPSPETLHKSSGTYVIPKGDLGDLVIVGGVGSQGTEGGSEHPYDIIDPTTGQVSDFEISESGMTSYPWVDEGQALVMITDRAGNSSADIEGTAYVVRPGISQVSLGPASDVLPSITQGVVWIVTSPSGKGGVPPQGGPDGQGCTIREMSITGKRLTPEYPMNCRRWLVDAVDGGLLSVSGVSDANAWTWRRSPAITPSNDFSLQVWNPETNRVERTISNHVSEIDGVSARYVEWSNQRELNDANGTVEITDVSSDATRTFSPSVPDGMRLENQPLLSPDGPLVAYTYVSKSVASKFVASEAISPPCCVTPVVAGSGRLRVDDFLNGKQLLDRQATISNLDASFAGGDSYIVVTSDSDRLLFIPTWSSTSPTTSVETPNSFPFSDAEDFVITTRP